MPGQRPILAMSFIASLGITFEVFACTVPKGESNLWPLSVLIFYFLLPLPILISKQIAKDTIIGNNDSSSKKIRDIALFFTSGIVVSSIALPLLLARIPSEKPLIAPISCSLVEIGNVLCYLTMALFCIYFKPFDGI